MLTVIERLEALAEKATARPWTLRDGYPADVLTKWEEGGGRGQLVICEHAGPDGDFIVAAVNALPDLLKLARAARRMRTQAAWMREHLGDQSTVATQAAKEYERARDAVDAALEPLFREVES
jgi:hypothetical protein